MTVREAFEKAYGEVRPEASCHLAADHGVIDGERVRAVLYWRNSVLTYNRPDGQWMIDHTAEGVVGPDISERKAWEFRGLFGDEYDRAVSGGVA